MPQVDVDGLTINYDVQGEGEPLLLIPYLSADHACYAFQLPAYTEHFSCISIDLPGTGESDKPPGPYSTEGYADQVACFLSAIGIEEAHVAGVSLGAAVAMHLGARHPERVRSLSLHSGWDSSDAYLKRGRAVAHAGASLPTIADVVIQAIFPLVLHARDVRDTAGVRRRPGGVRAWPPRAAARRVRRPARRRHERTTRARPWARSALRCLITFGAQDLVCSTRFAGRLPSGIAGSELVVFEHLSHAGLHEDPEAFNRATLDFLLRQRS